MASAFDREYFYRVDLRGHLLHAGTELTEPRFLDAFFRRLKRNETGRHPSHPFLSPCGREWNFVRADDRPIVFHTLTPAPELCYASSLLVPFEPRQLTRSIGGRLYHPAPVGEVGLLSSSLMLSLAERLIEVPNGYALGWGSEVIPIPLRPEDDPGE